MFKNNKCIFVRLFGAGIIVDLTTKVVYKPIVKNLRLRVPAKMFRWLNIRIIYWKDD